MSPPSSPLRGRKILVVDDEPELRECIVRDFRKLGCLVFEASNGNEALEVFEREAVDAIISDVRMPNGSGVDLLEEIRRRHPSIPVVLLITGFSDISESDAIGKGAYGVLEKPIDRKAMIATVEKSILEAYAA